MEAQQSNTERAFRTFPFPCSLFRRASDGNARGEHEAGPGPGPGSPWGHRNIVVTITFEPGAVRNIIFLEPGGPGRSRNFLEPGGPGRSRNSIFLDREGPG